MLSKGQRSENSRWSKIANSVAYFSEANSVSLISLSNTAGAGNKISNPESARTNSKTSNPETAQNVSTEKRVDSELSNPETTGSNPRRGNPTTTPVQYIRTNTFANADEIVVNMIRNCNPSLTRPTNNEPSIWSGRPWSSKEWCCCCFWFLFVCFIFGFILAFGFLI